MLLWGSLRILDLILVRAVLGNNSCSKKLAGPSFLLVCAALARWLKLLDHGWHTVVPIAHRTGGRGIV